jgi:hypothetical protein
MGNPATSTEEIKKLQLDELVLFTINNIPQADGPTLERFLELVHAGGTFGTISHEQILKKMHLVLKHIPNASAPSFLILMDLLEINPANLLALTASQTGWFGPNKKKDEPMPFFIDVSPVTQSLDRSMQGTL